MARRTATEPSRPWRYPARGILHLGDAGTDPPLASCVARRPARAPDFVASAESLLGEYLRSAQIETGNLRGSTLELVVVQWLVDVARGRAGSRNEPLVRDSGLGDAIADGVVEVPTAA